MYETAEAAVIWIITQIQMLRHSFDVTKTGKGNFTQNR